MSKVLVTGGCGFIGSHLVRHLSESEFEVVVVDNLSTGLRANIAADIQLIECDVADTHLYEKELISAEHIVHLAALPSVDMNIDEIRHKHHCNQVSYIALLQCIAKHNKGQALILASSAAIYGATPMLPVEEGTIANPLSPYAIDKLACEQYSKAIASDIGLSITALRFFNVYGPNQDPNSMYSGVVSKFINQLINESPVTIYGDGDQTRDFIFVEDVVKAIILVIGRKKSRDYQVFNVCSGVGTSVNVLLAELSKIVEKSVDTHHVGGRDHEIRDSVGSLAKINSHFGYKPEVGLSEGLQNTFEWYVANNSD